MGGARFRGEHAEACAFEQAAQAGIGEDPIVGPIIVELVPVQKVSCWDTLQILLDAGEGGGYFRVDQTITAGAGQDLKQLKGVLSVINQPEADDQAIVLAREHRTLIQIERVNGRV